MGFQRAGSLLKEIREKYDEDPVGWSIFKDKRSNMLIFGPGGGYSLKLVPINPREAIGVGVRLEIPEGLHRVMELLPSSGLRPLSKQDLKNLKATAIPPATATAKRGEGNQSRLLNRLLQRSPESLSTLAETQHYGVMTGPVISHPDLGSISERQRELQRRMKLEADKLFRERYPDRAGLYR